MKRFHVLSVLLVCTVSAAYLLALRLLFFQTTLPDLFPWLRQRATSHSYTDLLVIAHGRSGSSFLGQLFNIHPDVFYVYEPLAVLQATSLRHSPLYEESAKRLLEDILRCSFREQTEFLNFLSSLPLNRFSSRALTVPFCKNATDSKTNRTFVFCKDLNYRRTSRQCSLRRHRVIKVLTHRIPNMTLETFKRTLNEVKALKIINLVRDPRAIVASMNRVGWISEYKTSESPKVLSRFRTIPEPRQRPGNIQETASNRFHQRTKKFCFSLIKAMAFALEAERELGDRYLLVRYEDLVANVRQVTKRLYAFAGISFVERINEWISRSTHSWSRDEYSTIRSNISSRVDAWRKELDDRSIRMVEKYCWPILKILHYTPMHGQV